MKHKTDYGEKENSGFPGQEAKSTVGKTFALGSSGGWYLREAGGPAPSPPTLPPGLGTRRQPGERSGPGGGDGWLGLHPPVPPETKVQAGR